MRLAKRRHVSKEELTGRASEHSEQRKLAALLNDLLDATTFWCSIDNKPRSRTTGHLNRLVGIKRGVPDVMVISEGKIVFVELKTRWGTVSPAQRQIREEIVRAGGGWWLCRSARAALVALLRSGVRFRRAWDEPVLAEWEQPVGVGQSPQRNEARHGDGDDIQTAAIAIAPIETAAKAERRAKPAAGQSEGRPSDPWRPWGADTAGDDDGGDDDDGGGDDDGGAPQPLFDPVSGSQVR